MCCRRVSVRLSVTNRYCTEVAKHRSIETNRKNSSRAIVSSRQIYRRNCNLFTPTVAQDTFRVGQNSGFWPISRYISEINVKNCSLYTLLKGIKCNVNHTNIAWMSMLVWLTLPYYDFCSFRSVAVNSVYKLQFLTFLFAVLLTVLSRLLIRPINTTFFDFARWRLYAILDF